MKKIFAAITIALAFLAIPTPAQESRPVFRPVAQAQVEFEAQFIFAIDGEVVTLRDASTGELLAQGTLARLAQPGYSSDPRHIALDLTAALIAGGGEREATVSRDVKVVTVQEHDQGGDYPTVTIEHSRVFVIQSDKLPGGRYEALVYLFPGSMRER
jgi:hypothetical protein